MGAHVLVVDDDPQILRMLTEVLTKRGFGVDVAHDGEEAFGRAIAHPPDLLVTDVMMPKLDGWSLVRKLRLDPKLANLPVIFLTAVTTDDARVQAFRLGADDYVNKPFKFNDLVGRIEKVLGSKQPATKKQASSSLAGDLAQVGLSTLLVLVEMERKTGVLSVTAADGRSGRISARDGKVIEAGLDGAGQPSGAEAVYVMLTFTAGKFDFAVGAVNGEDKIKQSTTHLLMEGARLMDEASAPAAETQLNEEAIAEWGIDEPTPMVAAAKLADLVRRSARISVPPYAGHALSASEVAALAAAPPPFAASGASDAAAATAAAVEAAAKPATSPTTPPATSPTTNGKPEAAATTDTSSQVARVPKTPRRTTPSQLEAALKSYVEPESVEREPEPEPEPMPPLRSSAEKREAALARERARRRASPLWLVFAVLGGAAAAATFAMTPKGAASANDADVKADATAIGAALDRGVDSAQMRAEGVAAMPMLRAGIETDAATLQDMIANEMMLKPQPGEVIELFQVRDGGPAPVLRIPADGRAITLAGSHARLAPDGKSIELIATAPVRNQQGIEGGTLAVAIGVDLKGVGALASHTHGAKLTGLEQPIELAAGDAMGEAVTVPITTKAAQGLTLVASVSAAGATSGPNWVVPVRYACFALAGLLLVVYIGFAARASSARGA